MTTLSILKRLLRMARLEEGEDRHLILHELIHGEHLMNGMDFSYRMLLKTADLVRAHPGVHPMLANHEIAQLMKTRVTKGHGECVTLFRDALEFTFGEHHEAVEQALDEFIAAMALGVRAENGVWCSHSLPGRAVMSSFDPEIVRRPLVASDFEKPKGSAYLMTWGRVFEDADIDRLAEAWKVQLFCLGHRKVPTGVESEGERLVLVNSDHEGGSGVHPEFGPVPTFPRRVCPAFPTFEFRLVALWRRLHGRGSRFCFRGASLREFGFPSAASRDFGTSFGVASARGPCPSLFVMDAGPAVRAGRNG